MFLDEDKALRDRLVDLRAEHRDLDIAIDSMAQSPSSNALQVQRMKKQKLLLRDQINLLEDELYPDIIA